MSIRLVVVALLISSLAACTVPRTALVTGAATMIAGGALFANESSYEPRRCQSVYGCVPDPKALVALGEDIGSKVLGTVVIAIGLGIVTSGVVGLAQEKAREVPAMPIAPVATATIAPAPAALPAGARFRGDPPSTRPPSELAVQLRIAAHAGHCEAAAHLAHKLLAVDSGAAVELVKTDDAVARCVAYRM